MMGSPEDFDELVNGLCSRNPFIQNRVSRLLRSSDPMEVMNALTAVGFSEDPSWAIEVARLLSSDPISAGRAVWTLGALGASKYASEVAGFLGNVDTGYYAAAALAWMGAREYAPRIAALMQGPHDLLRDGAVDALAVLGTDEVENDLPAFLDSPNTAVRASTLRLVAICRLPGFDELILRHLSDHDQEVRRKAALAAGECGVRKGVPRLRAFANDKSLLWLAAQLSLVRLREKKTRDTLRLIENVHGRRAEADAIAQTRAGACDSALDLCDALAEAHDGATYKHLEERASVEERATLADVLRARAVKLRGGEHWGMWNVMRRGYRVSPRTVIMHLCDSYGDCFIVAEDRVTIGQRAESLEYWRQRVSGTA